MIQLGRQGPEKTPVVWDALEGATFSSKDGSVGLWFSLFLDGKLSFSSGFLPELNLRNARAPSTAVTTNMSKHRIPKATAMDRQREDGAGLPLLIVSTLIFTA